MSRLIDAERFDCIGFQATGERRYDDGFADGVMFISKRIDSAPTIPAIPVEWLRKEAEIQRNLGEWADANVIDWLEETWQKEQEAQDGNM